jgi:hypothetical protein
MRRKGTECDGTMGEYANGIGIAATVGARTWVGLLLESRREADLSEHQEDGDYQAMDPRITLS